MDIGEAIRNLRQGASLCRTGWNGKDMYVKLQVPDENSKMGRPYIYIKSVDGYLVPWVASQTDLLANDWQLV